MEASYHDLAPLHELSYGLPQGSVLYGDKAYLSAPDQASLQEACQVVLVTIERKNMKEQNTLSETFGLQRYRLDIETMNSQLESMGTQEGTQACSAAFVTLKWTFQTPSSSSSRTHSFPRLRG